MSLLYNGNQFLFLSEGVALWRVTRYTARTVPIPTRPATQQLHHHSKCDKGAALADGYRTVKRLLNTQHFFTDCNIQSHFVDFAPANLPHADQLITSEFHDLKNPGNQIKMLRKREMWPTGNGLVGYSKVKQYLYRPG
jgi:hypothetical protein